MKKGTIKAYRDYLNEKDKTTVGLFHNSTVTKAENSKNGVITAISEEEVKLIEGNKMFGVAIFADEGLHDHKHKHGKYHQSKRLYGDYLYFQDRARFDENLQSALKEDADFIKIVENL